MPVVAFGLLALLVVLGLSRDPFTSAHLRLEPPSFALPLGADGMVDDVLARVAHG